MGFNKGFTKYTINKAHGEGLKKVWALSWKDKKTKQKENHIFETLEKCMQEIKRQEENIK